MTKSSECILVIFHSIAGQLFYNKHGQCALKIGFSGMMNILNLARAGQRRKHARDSIEVCVQPGGTVSMTTAVQYQPVGNLDMGPTFAAKEMEMVGVRITAQL